MNGSLPDSPLKGKNVLISGGSTGIGRATARWLAARGARVFIFGRDRQAVDDAVADIPANACGSVGDQSKLEDVRRLFAEAEEKLGTIDILINNAAVGSDELLSGTDEEASYIVNANVVGYLWCTRLALPAMLKRGRGHIVNVGSMSAEKKEGSEIYTATKAAIRGFSDALRRSIGEKKVRVTLIEPGKTGTDLLEISTEEQEEKEARQEMLTAEEVAECIGFCLSVPERVSIARLQVVPLAHQS